MIDWNRAEESDIWEGIKAGGEYLDELGKTDLGALSRDELMQFVKCVLGRMVESQKSLNDEIPF